MDRFTKFAKDLGNMKVKNIVRDPRFLALGAAKLGVGLLVTYGGVRFFSHQNNQQHNENENKQVNTPQEETAPIPEQISLTRRENTKNNTQTQMGMPCSDGLNAALPETASPTTNG